MGALSIAFDITIVGALALPWVLLVIHVFFFEGENRLGDFLDWLKDLEQPAAVAVVLFALTYTLGSAVSRIAADFFNDDDLHFPVDGFTFRIGVTEDRIIASVYCKANGKERNLLPGETAKSPIAERMSHFREEQNVPGDGCERNLKWWDSYSYVKTDDDLIDAARDLFGLQENQLLLKGEDYTLRLRQLHDQIMVLRGAAFNSVITLSLCLFALGAKFRRTRAGWQRFAFAPLPMLYLGLAVLALRNHFHERPVTDPPYMEFTLFILGVAGAWLVGKSPRLMLPEPREVNIGEDEPPPTYWQQRWTGWIVLCVAIMLSTALGWWSTEVLYTQQVIYSYDSQLATPKVAEAAQK